jgi:AraC family transcriptional regulator
MSLTKRVLWIIERNLESELSLAGLAEACGVSACHLSHAFAEAAGRPLMDYLRARRLSCAAEALAAGAPDILDLALATGYASHEAFSRAFKGRFGETPEGVRRRATVAGLPLTAPLDMTDAAPRPLEPPRLEGTGALSLACLSARFSFGALQGIPALWQRFMSLYPLIEDKTDPIPLGVSSPIAEDGAFDYGCAVEISRASGIPRDLSLLRLPPRRYAIFRHAGHVSTLPGTYAAIWNEALPARGWTTPEAPSLERHHQSFDVATGEGGVSIWIPITASVPGANEVSPARLGA